MYETVLGRDGFRKGMDLYIKRHDGGAVTCDDFLAAMADANGADLSALNKWCEIHPPPRALGLNVAMKPGLQRAFVSGY